MNTIKYIDASKTTSGKERMDNLFNAEKTLLEDGALVPLQLKRSSVYGI